jgi:hypothetical protein
MCSCRVLSLVTVGSESSEKDCLFTALRVRKVRQRPNLKLRARERARWWTWTRGVGVGSSRRGRAPAG